MTGWGGPTGRAPWADPAVRLVSDDAARSAGVEIRHLEELPDMAEVEGLFERIWGPGGVTVPLLRSLSISGNYVAGAWAHEHLMGASVAFASPEPGRRNAHLHMTGVVPSAQGSGIGFALLCHQRAWALERGIEQITWTFDPLVRRNGWFATVKLGARCDAYYHDFFGYLNDPINRWDFTDRCLARWELAEASPGENRPADQDDPDIEEMALTILTEGAGGEPVLVPADWIEQAPELLLCQVPSNTQALRQSEPKLAREWLAALRGTLARALDAGYVLTSMTTGGCYVLRRPEG
ncbi:MAG TPA: GNAT family N-acetyltransferase [Acidimicrobiales bacterium]|nr:GNAT family N-acetyltransferase [Acidimicrobiales bacterium]